MNHKRNKTDGGLCVTYTKGEPLGVTDSVSRKPKLYFMLTQRFDSTDEIENLFTHKLHNASSVRLCSTSGGAGFVFFKSDDDVNRALNSYATAPTAIHPKVATLTRSKLDASFVVNNIPKDNISPQDLRQIL